MKYIKKKLTIEKVNKILPKNLVHQLIVIHTNN